MSATAVLGPPGGLAARLRTALADAWEITRRDLMHVRRVPEKLLDVTLQPIIFVLLFAYVFGSAISIPGAGGGGYRQFMMPGIFTMTVAGLYMSTAVAMADDMSKGVIDRFRSLPMSRSAVLAGRTVAALLESVIGLVVLVGMGLAVGWRAHNGAGQTIAALALLLLVGFAMNWVGTFVGLVVRSTDTAQVTGFLLFFPLTFVANTFVPTKGMTPALRTVDDWNPLSTVAASCRHLFGNPGAGLSGDSWPTRHPELAALGWCALLLAVFVPLAVRKWRTTQSR